MSYSIFDEFTKTEKKWCNKQSFFEFNNFFKGKYTMNKTFALIALVPFAIQAAPHDVLADFLYGDYGQTINYVQKCLRPAARAAAHQVTDKVIEKKIPNKEIVNKGFVKVSTNDLVKFCAHVGLQLGDKFLEESAKDGDKRRLSDVVSDNLVPSALLEFLAVIAHLPEKKVVEWLELNKVDWQALLGCPHAHIVAKGIYAETKREIYKLILGVLFKKTSLGAVFTDGTPQHSRVATGSASE